jgi:hypothetical protein
VEVVLHAADISNPFMPSAPSQKAAAQWRFRQAMNGHESFQRLSLMSFMDME